MPSCPFCRETGKCDACCGAGSVHGVHCHRCNQTGRCLACAGSGRWPTSEAASAVPTG